jgi:dynein assembly factor 1
LALKQIIMEMTRSTLRDICAQSKLYRTPSLNDKLYLNFKGFTHIAELDEYSNLKALFLEGNALQSLSGLPKLEQLKCL